MMMAVRHSGPVCSHQAPYAAGAINSNALNSIGLSCSEPAYSTAKLRLHAGNFCEKCHFLVTTTRIDMKPSRCPAHGLFASACKISLSYDTAFRRR